MNVLVRLQEAAVLAGTSVRKLRRLVSAGYLTAYEQSPGKGGWTYWYRKADVMQALTWWEKDHPRGRRWPKKEDADTQASA